MASAWRAEASSVSAPDGEDFCAPVLQLSVLHQQILSLTDKSVDLSLHPGKVGESFTSPVKVVVEIGRVSRAWYRFDGRVLRASP